MSLSNTLIDNSSEQLSMLHTLKMCFAHDEIVTAMIATGYWDIPGLALLAADIRKFLEKEGRRLLLLIGKDPYVYASQMKSPKYNGQAYPEGFIRTDINDLEVKEEYADAVNLLLDFCKEEGESKIEIRIFTHNENDESQFLHSKCYIFEGFRQQLGFGIIGSSNFTYKGLNGNAELNYLECDRIRVLVNSNIEGCKSHLDWFTEKWNLATPWNKFFLEQVLNPAPITKAVKAKKEELQNPFTPYELYIKLLQLKFGSVVDKQLGQMIESYLPTSVRRLNFQIEAVKRCIGIMREHGGFMLSDVVGLGKTIVGTLIIKHFLSVPDVDGREHKVLIVTPPAILPGWKKTIAMFDEKAEELIAPHVDFITTGSIGSLVHEDDEEDADDDINDTGDFGESLKEENYGLIVIDESHKFRNSDTAMYRALDSLIAQIGSNVGAYPYVGLLSATPQNNRPNDLKNQIYLFERNHSVSTLKKADGGDLEHFFGRINREYDSLISRSGGFFGGGAFKLNISPEDRKARLDAISHEIRDCVLCDILERRTRTDIEKYYAEDMKSEGLSFPKTVGPQTLGYKMDEELARLFFDTMSTVATVGEEAESSEYCLHYVRYRAIEYFVDAQTAKKYAGGGNRDVKDVARQLATIMQILLVKRLESSFAAFKVSLSNLKRYTKNMIDMWDNDTIFVCPQINVNEELNTTAKSDKRGHKVSFQECVEDIRAKIQKLNSLGKNEKGQNAEYKRSDFKPAYISLLKADFELISELCDRWANNTEDPKFDSFKECLKPQLFDPQKNTSGKLVIFSEALSTVDSLARAVRAKGFRPLVVKASNRKEMEHAIEENFDANYKGVWKDDYDVIITTEVLAEGVNLHRANVILNYDTPWNSTRLMQRIGRVNRIGSKEPAVYVFNFMPSAQGDAQIQLVRKAHTKLQSFHILFGEDNKIFSDDEDIFHYDISKDVDGEESPLQEYIHELKQFKATHPERYLQIEQTQEGWQIARSTDGTAFFVVKAPRSSRLAVCVKNNPDGGLKPDVVSSVELIEALKVDEDVQAAALPENWNELTEVALREYNQYFVRLGNSRSHNKQTEARGVINNIYYAAGVSNKSKDILARARRLVDRGNVDIMNKIIAIGRQLQNNDYSLIALGQQEIDEILERGIGQLLANVEGRQGAPKIVLGTIV